MKMVFKGPKMLQVYWLGACKAIFILSALVTHLLSCDGLTLACC